MSRAIVLRLSSVFLCLAGVATALNGWVVISAVLGRSYEGSFGFTAYVYSGIAYGIIALTGMALLIVQCREQRHWLGWVGVVVTLLGLLIMTGTTAYLLMMRSFTLLPPRMVLILFTLGSPLFSLGFVFWALDLPNTNRSLLAQKAIMGFIALLPIFESTSLLQEIFATTITIQNQATVTYLVPALLRGACWIGLGVCVLIFSTTNDAQKPNTAKLSFADSSVDMVVTPIPPEEL